MHAKDKTVGEVRVWAKLTNVVDEGLVRRGQLPPEQVRIYETEALVDTGAARSVIPPHVADELGLARVDHAVAVMGDGREEEVDLSDAVRFEIMGRRTVDEALILGDQILIGQTVLEKMDLAVDCLRGQLVPNQGTVDQPVFRV
jgi:clan AA aspartic protease